MSFCSLHAYLKCSHRITPYFNTFFDYLCSAFAPMLLDRSGVDFHGWRRPCKSSLQSRFSEVATNNILSMIASPTELLQ